MKKNTIIDAEMKNFLTSMILENKQLITEKFRELDPYKMMSVVAKILPYISTKEKNSKKAKNADVVSEFPELESETKDEGCKDDEVLDEENLTNEASVFLEMESGTMDEEYNDEEDEEGLIDDERKHCVVPKTLRKKSKKKKKKRKRK